MLNPYMYTLLSELICPTIPLSLSTQAEHFLFFLTVLHGYENFFLQQN